MNELEDILQHHGVKGMKWGVIRKNVKGKLQARRTKVIARDKSRLDKHHESNKNKKVYKKVYARSLKSHKGDHYKAVRTTRTVISELKSVRNQIVGSAAVGAATRYGPKLYKTATSPETMRKGKNIIQAIKRSPVRYVDGAKMSNIVKNGANATKMLNDARKLIGG